MNKTILLLLVFSFSTAAYAKQAQVLLYPTRIVLENNERAATLGLKNAGDATGGYRVELLDMHMGEDGSVQPLPENQAEPYSARRFVRISPRSVTLEPGQDQTIRILVRTPKELAEGEYRTHIKVTLMENDLDAVEGSAKETPEKAKSMVVKSRLSLIIPLIIRHGATNYRMGIAGAVIRYQDKTPYADIILNRQGNRSSMGDIDIEYIDSSGKKYPVKHLAGVPVYRPTERRKISLPLDIPPGLVIGKGKLHVTYKAQEKEGGVLLAEGSFALQ